MFLEHPDRCMLAPPARGLLVRQINLHDGSARVSVLYRQTRRVTAAHRAARDAALAAALADVPYRHLVESWEDGVGRRWVGEVVERADSTPARRTYDRVTREWDAPPSPDDARWLTVAENAARRATAERSDAIMRAEADVQRHDEQIAQLEEFVGRLEAAHSLGVLAVRDPRGRLLTPAAAPSRREALEATRGVKAHAEERRAELGPAPVDVPRFYEVE